MADRDFFDDLMDSAPVAPAALPAPSPKPPEPAPTFKMYERKWPPKSMVSEFNPGFTFVEDESRTRTMYASQNAPPSMLVATPAPGGRTMASGAPAMQSIMGYDYNTRDTPRGLTEHEKTIVPRAPHPLPGKYNDKGPTWADRVLDWVSTVAPFAFRLAMSDSPVAAIMGADRRSIGDKWMKVLDSDDPVRTVKEDAQEKWDTGRYLVRRAGTGIGRGLFDAAQLVNAPFLMATEEWGGPLEKKLALDIHNDLDKWKNVAFPRALDKPVVDPKTFEVRMWSNPGEGHVERKDTLDALGTMTMSGADVLKAPARVVNDYTLGLGTMASDKKVAEKFESAHTAVDNWLKPDKPGSIGNEVLEDVLELGTWTMGARRLGAPAVKPSRLKVGLTGAGASLATGTAITDAVLREDAKGGRFDVGGRLFAGDNVPESIFGIPVVAGEENYTPEDLAFFKEHPEAGGYYDLGEDQVEAQADDKGGDEDERNTLLRETVRASWADLTRTHPRDRTADDLSPGQKAALAKAWSVDGDGIYSYNSYDTPKGGSDSNAFHPGYWTNRDPNHQVEKLFGRATAHWGKDGDLMLTDYFDLGMRNLPGVPTDADPNEYKIRSRISARALGLDPEALWRTGNARIQRKWETMEPTLNKVYDDVKSGKYTGGNDTVDRLIRDATSLQARYKEWNSGPYKQETPSTLASWKDPFVRNFEEFNEWADRQPAAKISTRPTEE